MTQLLRSKLKPNPNYQQTLKFEAIGTTWQIDYDTHLQIKVDELNDQIRQRINQFDQRYSRFRPDSLITSMSQKAGVYPMPEDGFPLFEIYYRLHQLTNGKFTPLIGQVLSDLGYDSDYSLKARLPQSPPEWSTVLNFNAAKIETQQPLLLDFGAAGKGYLVDLVAQILDDYQISQYCIDASGDILHQGQSLLTIGLENPYNSQQVIGTVVINNQSLCASAGNRRQWGEYHHIIDPKTLKSVTAIKAVWVIADSAIVADAIATALFLVEPQKLLDNFEFSYLILNSNGTVIKSPDFKVELFLK